MSRRLVDGKQPKRSPTANKGGRPSMLLPDADAVDQAKVVGMLNAIKIGAPVTTAAAFQGISYETIRRWVLKGHESPDSIYGALLQKINLAIAEYEMRDLAVIEKHASGAPAEYEMEVVKDKKGNILMVDGKPLMQIARDKEGDPIIRRHAIKSDWKAAMERLARRKPKFWAPRMQHDVDAVLTFDNKKPETKEAQTFEDKVGEAMRKFEEEY